MSRDQSPILPSSVTAFYPRRRCQGAPGGDAAAYYAKKVNFADVGQIDPDVSPGLKGQGGSTTRIVHDTACALSDPGGGADPSNKAALDDLATQIAQDYYDWATFSVDRVQNGIAPAAPNGLLDTIEFRYDAADQWTRVQSAPWDGDPIEYQHQDPAVSGCTDKNNAGKPIQPVPCLYYYGPPEDCTGGGATETATVDGDGAITSIHVDEGGSGYTTAPEVCFSEGEGSGAKATATIAAGKVTAVNVTDGGGGYSPNVVVSFRGGGTNLQRCRYRLCLEDGRLKSYFHRYETPT